MKKILYLLSVTVLFLAILTTAIDAQEKRYKIGVFFWHESSIDYMAFEGIKDGFETAGINPEFDIQKAYGDEDKADKIIKRWVKQKPDMIYAMGTGATKRLMKVVKDTPIVFTAVTNPVQSGITPNWKTSGRNIAGNSNWIPTDHILEDFKEVVPALKTLGVMYDPGNAVSSMEIRLAGEVADSIGIKLAAVEVKSVDDLLPTSRSLVEKGVEAVWIPIDILVYKNLDRLRQATDPAKVPLVASSHRGVKDGAIFGIVVDYHALGKRSVPIALKILTGGVAPKDIPVGTVEGRKHIFNLKVARKIGYKIPLAALAVADEIIE